MFVAVSVFDNPVYHTLMIACLEHASSGVLHTGIFGIRVRSNGFLDSMFKLLSVVVAWLWRVCFDGVWCYPLPCCLTGSVVLVWLVSSYWS